MSLARYFRKKSITDLVRDAQNDTKLQRSLSALNLILLGIGAIVGAGIFVLTGTAASQSAGPAVTLSFLLSGVAASCAALCYAELSSMIPVSGSAYTYMYATLGELAAWIVGTMLVVGNILVVSSVAAGWSGYTLSLLHHFDIHLMPQLSHTTGTLISFADGTVAEAWFNLPAIIIMVVITGVLIAGIQTSAMINNITVFIKMSVLGLFVILGLSKVQASNWIPFIPENTGYFGHFGWSGIVGGAAMVFMAFNGFDTVATAAQESKNPQRDLPIGILGSLLVCTVTYILIAGVLTGLVNYQDLNVAEPIALAVDRMQLPWFSLVVKFGAIAGLTSVLLVMSYSIVRVLFIITEDGLLPAFLGRLHSGHHTPYLATVLVCSAIAVVGSTIPLSKLVQFGNFCIIVVFIIVCFATIYLRYTQPHLQRVFKCPMMPWVPLAGIMLFAQILYGMPDPEVVSYFAVLIVVSILIYLVYGSRNSRLNAIEKGK